MRVLNQSRDTVLGERVEKASSFWRRFVGLLSRSQLRPGEGLWLVPCAAIHSVGMRFRFDAIFLDAEKRVVKVVEALPPMQLLTRAPGAHSVLELPIGTVRTSGTEKGDQICFQKE